MRAEPFVRAERGLLLRPWRLTDAAAVLTAFRAPDMARMGRVGSSDEAVGWVNGWTHRQVAGTGYALAVLSAAGDVVGHVSVTGVDRDHGTGWVAYWTTPDARGAGVATAGLRAFASWAYTALELFRLELGHRIENVAACAVATRAGFAVEGVQRAKRREDDGRHDVELHARLASDPVPDLPAAGPAPTPDAGPDAGTDAGPDAPAGG